MQVLELFHIPGGSSSLSGGVCYMGGGTPLQKALGFEDTPEDMYRYLIEAGGPYAPADKIQLYCEESLGHYDWLVGNGVEYARVYSDEKELAHHAASLYHSGSERNHPYRDRVRPAPRGHVPPATNMMGGQRLMASLLASAERLGIPVRTRVACERLVTESDGTIAGVAVRENGVRRHVRARRGVVLAAGGFIHNPEMLKRHAPELYPCSGHWGRAGDLGMGIRMGMGVGGNVLRMHHGFAVLPLYPPENVLKGVAVNRLGQRCIAEDAYYGAIGHEFLYNQGGRGWLIVDASLRLPGTGCARGRGRAGGRHRGARSRARIRAGRARGDDRLLQPPRARGPRPVARQERGVSSRRSSGRRSRPTISASRRRSTRSIPSAVSRPRSPVR